MTTFNSINELPKSFYKLQKAVKKQLCVKVTNQEVWQDAHQEVWQDARLCSALPHLGNILARLLFEKLVLRIRAMDEFCDFNWDINDSDGDTYFSVDGHKLTPKLLKKIVTDFRKSQSPF